MTLRITLFLLGFFLWVNVGLLTFARREPAQPVWRAVVRYTQTGAYIFLQRANNDQAPLIQITPQRGIYRSVTWSPDGKKLAFINYGLLLADVNKRSVKSLTTTFDGSPAWSPDGAWLAFMSNRNDKWDIYKIQVETGEVVQLAQTPRDDVNPRWSADGEWVYFQSYVEGTWFEFRVPSDGSGMLERLSVISDEDEPSQFSPIIDYRWRGGVLLVMGGVLLGAAWGMRHEIHVNLHKL